MKTLILAALVGSYQSTSTNCHLVVEQAGTEVNFSCPDCSTYDGLNEKVMNFPKSYVENAKLEFDWILIQKSFPMGVDIYGHDEVVLTLNKNNKITAAKFATNSMLIDFGHSSWGCKDLVKLP
jgi:hypothetical protein